jgi:hypothetical protein
MKMYLTTFLGLFGSLMLTTALAAVEPDEFGTLDFDHNGFLSHEEVAASNDVDLITNWSNIDTDENGMIDAAEFSSFEAMQQPDGPADEAFQGGCKYDYHTLDVNQDGSLSPEEVLATNDDKLMTNWSNIDTDGNGVIDQAEFTAFKAIYLPMCSHIPVLNTLSSSAVTAGVDTTISLDIDVWPPTASIYYAICHRTPKTVEVFGKGFGSYLSARNSGIEVFMDGKQLDPIVWTNTYIKARFFS